MLFRSDLLPELLFHQKIRRDAGESAGVTIRPRATADDPRRAIHLAFGFRFSFGIRHSGFVIISNLLTPAATRLCDFQHA